MFRSVAFGPKNDPFTPFWVKQESFLIKALRQFLVFIEP